MDSRRDLDQNSQKLKSNTLYADEDGWTLAFHCRLMQMNGHGTIALQCTGTSQKEMNISTKLSNTRNNSTTMHWHKPEKDEHLYKAFQYSKDNSGLVFRDINRLEAFELFVPFLDLIYLFNYSILNSKFQTKRRDFY